MELKNIYLRHDLGQNLNYPLPSGYRFRLYDHPKDIETWTNILCETKEYSTKEAALNRFKKEFLPYIEGVKKRMCFLETEDGRAIGTATAWYGAMDDQLMGRLHWVEIIPEFQSKGLGRPLIAEAMRILKAKHKEAYLTTQSRSKVAIHLYLDLGWTPIRETEEQKEAFDSLPNDDSY